MNTTSAIKHLLNQNFVQVSSRNLTVNELLHRTIEIDSTKPISTFKNRHFSFRYLLGEFLWYLNGSFNPTFINKFTNFWSTLTDENNQVNSNYGQIILQDQFVFAYNTLVKDKYSRQAIMNINAPKHQEKPTKDFPCTLNVLFYIRGEELNMRVHMRSQDIFYGLQYDVPWYSFVHQNMYLLLKEIYPNLRLGKYYHQMDNVHYYERHFDLVKQIKKEHVDYYYSFILHKPIITIKNDKAIITKEINELYRIIDETFTDKFTWNNESSKNALVNLPGNFITIERVKVKKYSCKNYNNFLTFFKKHFYGRS